MTEPFALYGIFGFPLGHTLSPPMQEAAFRAVGLKAFYLPFELTTRDFLRLMQARRRLVLDGFNVTVPHKEEVLHYLDRVDPTARAIGAVNTVVRKGKSWVGFNTDCVGFMTALENDAKFRPRGKQALVLGAGGSARAVVYALAKKQAKKIVVVNRTTPRAHKMVSEYGRLFSKVELVAAEGERAGDMDLVVNATSVGLRPSDPSLVDPSGFPKKTLFFDLVYKPAQTRFLRSARATGHLTMNGLGMLLYQGAEAFRLWTGKKPPLGVMRDALTQGWGCDD